MKGARKELIGPYELHHPKTFPAITEDPFHLIDFLLKREKFDTSCRAIDIGTATGVIPLLLASRSKVGRITGVEVDAGLASCARENVERNGLEKRIKIINADFRELPKTFSPGSFDIVVSNPPYIKSGHGRVSGDRRRAIARSEKLGGLKELVKLSKYLLNDKGSLYLIFPLLRKAELLNELASNGFIVAREELVRGKKDSEAKLFMVEAKRGGELLYEI